MFILLFLSETRKTYGKVMPKYISIIARDEALAFNNTSQTSAVETLLYSTVQMILKWLSFASEKKSMFRRYVQKRKTVTDEKLG